MYDYLIQNYLIFKYPNLKYIHRDVIEYICFYLEIILRKIFEKLYIKISDSGHIQRMECLKMYSLTGKKKL
jgi:hypothetical protein